MREQARVGNKRAIEKKLGLIEDDGLLFTVITRLAGQKGMDVVLESLPSLVASGARLALLGSGEAAIEQGFQAAAVRYPGKIAATIGYDETLARYRQRYQIGGAEMGKLTFDDLAVKQIGDTAIVTGRWTLDRTADTPTGLFTLRMELTADGWKIVDDHTSAVEPTPQKVKNPEKK